MQRRYNYRSRRKKRGGGGFILFFIFLLSIAGVVAYVYISPRFERIAPRVELDKSFFWAPGKKIKIWMGDNQGLGSYEVLLDDGNKEITIASGKFPANKKNSEIFVTIPAHSGLDLKKKSWRLKVEVRDSSLWNFWQGNRTLKEAKILVDTEPPSIGIVAWSPSIVKGGSGLVIFRATDKHLKDVYVQIGKKHFKVVKYKVKGYWATLLAWPFRDKIFDPKVVAIDEAGNRSEQQIAFERLTRKFRISWIHLSDRFLNGKIKSFSTRYADISSIRNPLKRFKAVNEKIRIRNEKLIHHYTANPTAVNFSRWRLHAFYPLKSAARVADFGDERHYYYNDRNHEVSRSYHLGYDLASVRQAPIISSNPATVVFVGRNGIYGNMPILDHGFGLYTIYGHCSSILVGDGDRVRRGQVIARTGTTGLALGDHLHFGILIQGVEVWPMDWMKQNWINSHINNVFKTANRIIGRRRRHH